MVQGNIPSGATQFTVDHTYTTAGDYSVGLEVSDDDGGMDSATHEVTVEEDFSVYLPVLLGP